MKKRILRLPERSVQAAAMVKIYGNIAQLGESLPVKQRVAGSIPAAPFIQIRFLQFRSCFSGALAAKLLCMQQYVDSNQNIGVTCNL